MSSKFRLALFALLSTAVLSAASKSASGLPKVYLRFKVLEPRKSVYCELSSLRRLTRPYLVHFVRPVPRSGKRYPSRWIKPGEYSKWIDITRLLEKSRRTDDFASSTVHLAFFSDKPLESVKAEIELSSSKSESGIARKLVESVSGTNKIGILVPWDVKSMPDKIESISENVKHRSEYVDEVLSRMPPDSKTPKKIILEANCQAWPAPNIAEMEKRLLERMGFNSILHLPGGYKLDKLHLDPKRKMVWGGCDNPPNFTKSVERLCLYNLPEKPPANLYSIIMRDEPATSLNGKGHVYKCANCAAAFRRYLKKRGCKPADFALKSWNEVVPTPRPDDGAPLSKRKLHYLTVRFANHSASKVFKTMRGLIHDRYKDGGKVLCTTNYADHPFLKRGMKLGALDMFDLGESHAVDLLWTEDWLSSVGWFTVSNELSSYLGALFRCAAKYHNLPFGVYVTNGDGVSTRQKTYSFLSQGAKIIHYYDYGPRYAKTDYGFWSDNKPRVKAVCELSREIAKVEDLLYPAKIRKAETAILYSRPSDVWEKGDEPFILERRFIFLALAHSQIPVDFLSESDVDSGALKDYKVLYVVGPCVPEKTMLAIKKWVSDGGTLCVDAGSGLRDEYNSPSKTLFPVMGISMCDVNMKKWDYAAGARDARIMKLPPMGALKAAAAPFGPASFKAYACRQDVFPENGAKPVATFDSGAPAILVNKFGKGRCVLFNFLPGISYVRGSNFTGKTYTTEYPAALRRVISAPAKLAGVVKPVELSAPVVEASLLESKKGYVVMLNNYSMKKIPSLNVVLRGVGDPSFVESLKNGKVKCARCGGNAVKFSMPLGASDIISIRR